MRKISFLLILILMLAVISGCYNPFWEDRKQEYILTAELVHFKNASDITFAYGFDKYFENGKWDAYKKDSDTRIVEFTGNCDWKGKSSECIVQFYFNKEIKLQGLGVKMNGVELNERETDYLFSQIIKKVREYDAEVKAKQEATSQEAKQVKNSLNNQKSYNSTSANTSSNLETAKKQLEYRGIMGNVVATSYGHSSNGFLAQYDDGNIILLDKMTNRVIKVSPPDAIKRIADYQGSGNTSVKLELLIMNDSRDSDEKSGVWKGNNHLLPVTVEYKFENGAHIPGMIKSGVGASPAAYNNYLYETKNVDAVNMIIEEAAALK